MNMDKKKELEGMIEKASRNLLELAESHPLYHSEKQFLENLKLEYFKVTGKDYHFRNDKSNI